MAESNYNKISNNDERPSEATSGQNGNEELQSETEGLNDMLESIRNGSDTKKAWEMLRNAEKTDALLQALKESTIVGEVIKLLLRGKIIEVKKDAATLLAEVTSKNSFFCVQVNDYQGVPVLMREIRNSSDDEYIGSCLSSLVNTVLAVEVVEDSVVTLGGVQLGLRLINNTTSSLPVKTNAALLLANLVLRNYGALDEVRANDGLGIFVKLIEKDDDRCIGLGGMAFAKLFMSSPEVQEEALKVPGLVEKLMDAIRNDTYSVKTRCRCVVAILSMCVSECEGSKNVVKLCKDNFLTIDLVTLQKEINDGAEIEGHYKKDLSKLIEIISF